MKYSIAILSLLMISSHSFGETQVQNGEHTIMTTPPAATTEPLHTLTISIVSEDGSKLTLSDNTKYDVCPDDQGKALGAGFSGGPVFIQASEDPEYPFKITNLGTEDSIRVKKSLSS